MKRLEVGGLTLGVVVLILIIWIFAAAKGKAGMGEITPNYQGAGSSGSSAGRVSAMVTAQDAANRQAYDAAAARKQLEHMAQLNRESVRVGQPPLSVSQPN